MLRLVVCFNDLKKVHFIRTDSFLLISNKILLTVSIKQFLVDLTYCITHHVFSTFLTFFLFSTTKSCVVDISTYQPI